ncbi:hypothetical protein J1N35_014740 [Gossypium stocksii]|uniref:Uncharacterized protein n=1 Tax=Gossypium stocksii TaxID=47602 RepID=A0A9D4A9N6_9ROSI|nr:hypothetical protein J1N35_014740 [Gossypium stocksii]
MADDRVLEGFIHNMGKLAILEIRGHLQQARFLHASHMIRGYKLSLTLINALCTITLEYVVLQLDLLVDGLVITGSTVVLDIDRWLSAPIVVVGLVATTFLRPKVTDPYMFSLFMRPGVAVVRVEETYSAATARPKGVAQGGHAEEERQQLDVKLSPEEMRRHLQFKRQRWLQQQQHRKY